MQGKFAYFAVQFEFLNQLFNHIMKTISKLICVMLCVFATTPAFAQFNLKKAVGGAAKAWVIRICRCRRYAVCSCRWWAYD